MTGRRRRRRPARHAFAVVVVLAVAGLLGLAAPQTAQARTAQVPAGSTSALALPNPFDCKNPPAPEVPGRGVVGFFEGAPATLPPAGDPFAANSTTSIHEQYGYAGLRWNTYDLGCGPDTARDPEAVIGTSLSNWMYGLAKTGVAATGALLGAAYQPDFLKVFDALVTNVADALHRAVFQQWAAFVLAMSGFLLVWRARRAKLASSAAAVGWALAVMVIATALFQWPLVAGQAADKTVTASLAVVTGALGSTGVTPGNPAGGSGGTGGSGSTGGTGVVTIPHTAGDEAAANLHEALLYQTWLGGEFGSAKSDVARRYGPAIFDAQALTWREADVLKRDPAAGARIIAAKEAKFKDVAAKIQAEDPDAYEYLIGHRSDARVGYAVLAVFAVACAVPFLLLSALLVLGALVIVRLAVMLFPAVATLGLFPTMRGLVLGVGNTVAAALINALVFGLGAAVMVKAFGVVMSPATGLPGWLVVALVLLLTIVMWFALKPFLRLTQMVGARRNHFGEGAGGVGTITRAVGRFGSRVVTTALGVVVGDVAARKATQDDREDREQVAIGHRRAEADYAPLVTDGPVVVPLATGRGAPPGAGGDASGQDQPVRGFRLRRGERAETPRAPAPDPEATSDGGGVPGGGARPIPLRPPARAGADDRSDEDVRVAASTGLPPRAAAAEPDGQGELPTWRPDDRDTDGLPRPIEPDDVSGEEVYVIYRPDREPLTRSPGRRRG